MYPVPKIKDERISTSLSELLENRIASMKVVTRSISVSLEVPRSKI